MFLEIEEMWCLVVTQPKLTDTLPITLSNFITCHHALHNVVLAYVSNTCTILWLSWLLPVTSIHQIPFSFWICVLAVTSSQESFSLHLASTGPFLWSYVPAQSSSSSKNSSMTPLCNGESSSSPLSTAPFQVLHGPHHYQSLKCIHVFTLCHLSPPYRL